MSKSTKEPPKPMPLLSISSPETIQKCASLPLRPDDIFICSFPKSGTTWMQHIVLSLLFQNQQQRSEASQRAGCGDGNKRNDGATAAAAPFYNHVSEYAPFFEIDPHWHDYDLVPWIQDNHARIGRRIFNTHLRFDMLPKPPPPSPSPSQPSQPSQSSSSSSTSTSPSASQQQQHKQGKDSSRIQTPCFFGKFVYIIRSPLDTCVSFYHHLSHQVQGGYENGSFDDFFQEWLMGAIPFGSWLDHVQSYTTGIETAATARPSFVEAAGRDNTAGDEAFTNCNNYNPRCPVVRLVDGREFFVVTYEEMCCNLSTVVADLRDFLDLTTYTTTNSIDDADGLLLQTFSFAYMKANQDRFQPKCVEWKNNFSFLRHGVPGDAAMALTKEQHERFQTALEQSPLWQRVLDEKDDEASPIDDDDNNAVQLLLSKIKRLLVTAVPTREMNDHQHRDAAGTLSSANQRSL